jgi:phage gp46-like protein
MTDIYTRFQMQDADTFPAQGTNYPAVLRGFPFATDVEFDALLLAIQAVADGSLAVTVNGVPLDTGPIDFTTSYPPILDGDGNEVEGERWEFASGPLIADAIQEALGAAVVVVWVDGSRNFRITSATSGWGAHISYARGGATGTDISSILRLTEANGADVTEGRVIASASSQTGGIQFPSGDWVFEPPDLVNDEGLDTAVVLSLFTHALARPDDVLPGAAEDDRQGWWAQPWGSRLWLLSREKWTEDVRARAEFYAEEALHWMIDDGVADRVEVEARLMEVGTIAVAVAIYRDGRLLFAKPYGALWQATVSTTPVAARR